MHDYMYIYVEVCKYMYVRVCVLSRLVDCFLLYACQVRVSARDYTHPGEWLGRVPAQLKIVGHAADPNDCEEWGDDFVFDEDSKSSLGSSGEAVPASASGDIPGKAIPLHQPSSSMEDGAATLSHRQSWSSGGPAGGGGFLKLHKQRAVPPPLGASQSNKANSLSRRISIRRSHFRSSLALPTPSEEQLAVLNEFMEFAIFLPGTLAMLL